MNEIEIGQKIGFLTIIDKYNKDNFICQCICGNKIFLNFNDLNDNRKKISCGCGTTSRELPTLYKLWQRFSTEEKKCWGDWENFLVWSKKNKYEEVFSYYKPNRNLPYNKDNLLFGLFINKEFFKIEDLRKCKYLYNNKIKKFVTSKRIKNIIVSEDEVTKALNKQKTKHKMLPDKVFNKFKKKINCQLT